MNKLLLVFLLLFTFKTSALEKQDIFDISLSELTSETQKQAKSKSDNHLSFLWWVPLEYWNTALTRDPNVNKTVKAEMIKILEDYNIFAMVQADVSAIGAFEFYPKESIEKVLKVTFINESGNEVQMKPVNKVSPSLDLLLSQVTPILKAAMGNLGENLYFFIYTDIAENGKRLINPFSKGNISIDFSNKEKERLNVEIKLPLNSLFKPRICPNGEKAHVSWKYCPWSGSKI